MSSSNERKSKTEPIERTEPAACRTTLRKLGAGVTVEACQGHQTSELKRSYFVSSLRKRKRWTERCARLLPIKRRVS